MDAFKFLEYIYELVQKAGVEPLFSLINITFLIRL